MHAKTFWKAFKGAYSIGMASEFYSNLCFFMIENYCEKLSEFLLAVFKKNKFQVSNISLHATKHKIYGR